MLTGWWPALGLSGDSCWLLVFCPLYPFCSLHLSLWLSPRHMDLNQHGPSPLCCRPLSGCYLAWFVWVHPHSGKLLWSHQSHPLEAPSPCGFATEGSPPAKALSQPCQDLPMELAGCSVPPYCRGCPSLLQAFFSCKLYFTEYFYWRRVPGHSSGYGEGGSASSCFRKTWHNW